jgi:hypothetical protein
MEDPEQLNIPFGSFFNRYLLNRLEGVYPYLDNVRPRDNVLPLLFRERFFLGVRVLFEHVPLIVNTVPKRYFHYMFRRFLLFVLALLAPVVALVILQWPLVKELAGHFLGTPKPATRVEAEATAFVTNFGLLFVSYMLSRIAARFQLVEPDSLAEPGLELIEKHGYHLVTFGHTHNPEQIRVVDGKGEHYFFNTGTWIPIVQISTAELRDNNTFAFLHIRPDANGELHADALEKWNDAAERREALVVIARD